MRFTKWSLLAITAALVLIGLTAALAADASHTPMTPDQRLALAKQELVRTQDSPRPPHNTLDDYVVQDTTYSWIDMTGATQVTMTDDDNQGPFTLGFTFPYFGNNYTTMRISSNGSITPTDTIDASNIYLPSTRQCLPSAETPNNMLYGFWSDLDPSAGGTIKYRSDVAQGRFVVAWENVPMWGVSNTLYTFQIVIRSDGTILYNWGTLTGPDSCFVGIENANGTQALQVWCCNQQLGTRPVSNSAKKFFQADGVPNPVTNLLGNANGTSVTLTWTDPTQDTNGNPLTPDSILIYRGDTQPASQIGHVAHGVQTFTATDQPSGNLTFYVRAKSGQYLSAPASVTVLVGNAAYNNNFDADNGMWTADNAVWAWGAPTNPAGPQAHSTPNVWSTGLTANYNNSVCGHLDLNLGLAINSPTATVEFWAWWNIENSWDGCNFKVSTDDGATWQLVTPQGGYNGTTNGSWACSGQEQAWMGQHTTWTYVVLPIGQFNGEVPRFRFTFGSDGSVQNPGFFFDDMIIWGMQAPQGASVSGTVTLDGGNGNVTQAVVAASGLGSPTTNPAANGSYTLANVQVGTGRRITASLAGYETDTLVIDVPAGGYTGANLTLRRLPPPAPTNLVGTVQTLARKDSLHWDVSPDLLVDGYKVYRKFRDSTNWVYRQTVNSRTQNWVRDTLEIDGVFNYAVTAIDNGVTNPPVESDRSNVIEQVFGHLPPQMLTANGNFDNKIRLSWLDPNAAPESELFYDNGANSPGIGGIGFNGTVAFGWLVSHFQTTSGAATIGRIKVYFTQQAIDGDAFQVGIFADSGNGTPTRTALGVLDLTHQAPYDAFQEWTLTTPVTIPGGSFFVGVRQITANNVSVGGDQATPFINNTFFYNGLGAAWATFESASLMAIPLIRCFAQGSFGGGLADGIELAPTPVQRNPFPVATFPGNASRTVINAAKSGHSMESYVSENGKGVTEMSPAVNRSGVDPMNAWTRMAHLRNSVAPHAPYVMSASASGHGGHALDDVIRYLIYRDDALRDSVLGTVHTYDDQPLPENQPHSYYVKARYDDNGLSPASNTVANARCNMAPAAPGAMTLLPVGDTQMRITWTDPTTNADGTPCVDLAGIRIYRDNTLITATPVAPGVQQYTDSPPDPATRYTWSVRAIDEVPNESAGADSAGSVTSPWHPVDYEWVDISTIGTNTGLNSDDQNVGPFDLGFDFPFYGQTFSSIRVCSNGFLSFNSTATTYTNATLPGAANPTCAIYPFWDDLNLSSGGAVKYYADAANQRFIIAYLAVPHFSSGGPYTFEIILEANGGIRFEYQITTPGQSVTVGVENCDHSDAIQLCYNGAGDWCPTDNSAVQFWGGPNQSITGIVRHLGGANPVLAGVWVSNGTDSTQTDNAGNYSLHVEPGTYSVSFRHAQHCDTVRSNVVVEPNVNTTLNMSMRSPNATLSATSLTFVVHQNQTQQEQFTIQNVGGSCPLSFQITDSVAWLSSTPASGTVDPGQTQTITVTAAPGNINPSELHTTMRVVCNAVGSPFVIQVDMNVLNVGPGEPGLPTEFALHTNYPNPFNPTTTLPFDVAQQSQVDIVIYNVNGQEVAHPVSSVYAAGRYRLTIDASSLSSGLYLVKMNAGNFTGMRKIMLLK